MFQNCFFTLILIFFSNTEMTANSSDEIVISDEDDHGDEVLVVNESCETGVDLESQNKISEPLNNQDRNNDSGSGNSDIIIMEEDMAVDLSITSKNSKEGEGKYTYRVSQKNALSWFFGNKSTLKRARNKSRGCFEKFREFFIR